MKTSLYLEADEAKALKQKALDLGVKANDIVRVAVRKYLGVDGGPGES